MTTGTAREPSASADRQSAVRTQSSGFPVTPGRAWGMTGLVIFLYVVNYADKAVLGIIAQPLARELDMSSSQIGLVGSLFYATYTVGGFLAGPLEKRFTLRWALLALALVWSVVMFPLVVSATFVTLVAGRMLLGFGEGPSAALLHTAMYSWHPRAKRGLPGALLAGAPSVAKIALAPALTFITVQWGWRAALVSLSLLGLVWMVLWLAWWKEGPYTGRVAQGTDTAPRAHRTVRTLAQDRPEPHLRQLRLHDNRRLRTLDCCTHLVAVVFRGRSRLQCIAGRFDVRASLDRRAGPDDRVWQRD